MSTKSKYQLTPALHLRSFRMLVPFLVVIHASSPCFTLIKVGSVAETAELLLHGLRQDYRKVSKVTNHMKARIDLPELTGVRTGVTLVNSESKLLVSVAFLIVGMNGGATRLWKMSSQLTFRKNG